MHLHSEILLKIVSDRLFPEFKLNTVILERTDACRQYITFSHAFVSSTILKSSSRYRTFPKSFSRWLLYVENISLSL